MWLAICCGLRVLLERSDQTNTKTKSEKCKDIWSFLGGLDIVEYIHRKAPRIVILAQTLINTCIYMNMMTADIKGRVELTRNGEKKICERKCI
jgi:hypothetical protein